mmetsp:Transcript_85749/g.119042  ORF Transcript_85749/g.119042 Transcript_85749/m.119042 type:complete len:234 (+) Transcript_85749:183-884(+)
MSFWPSSSALAIRGAIAWPCTRASWPLKMMLPSSRSLEFRMRSSCSGKFLAFSFTNSSIFSCNLVSSNFISFLRFSRLMTSVSRGSDCRSSCFFFESSSSFAWHFWIACPCCLRWSWSFISMLSCGLSAARREPSPPPLAETSVAIDSVRMPPALGAAAIAKACAMASSTSSVFAAFRLAWTSRNFSFRSATWRCRSAILAFWVPEAVTYLTCGCLATFLQRSAKERVFNDSS